MGDVVVGMSVSVDGFVAGPNDGPGNPLGDGGDRLFAWWTAGSERVGPDDRFRPPAASREVVRRMFDCGAVIAGRRTFDIAQGWGGRHPAGCPFFVLTHRVPDRWVGPGTDGTAVTDGIEHALALAQAVAGDRDVSVMSASVARQYLRATLVDEIRLDVVPVVLGGGIRLFDGTVGHAVELRRTLVVPSDGVTHLHYRVVR